MMYFSAIDDRISKWLFIILQGQYDLESQSIGKVWKLIDSATGFLLSLDSTSKNRHY